MPDAAPSRPPERLLKIGEVARRCNVSARTVRFYEEMGLVNPEATTDGGFRLYSEADVERIEKIIRLKDSLNFTLEEVREVLEADEHVQALIGEGRVVDDPHRKLEILDDYLAAIDRQRRLVLAKRESLDAFLTDLDARSERAEARRAEYEALRDAVERDARA